jgi:hypothetical protein
MEEQAKPAELLYHYTNQDGLLGIIESQAFRATDVRFLNDTEEFEDGLRIAIQMAEQASANAGENGENIVKYLKAKLRYSFSSQPVYSVSLTGALKGYETLRDSIDDPGDRLNMWRSYTVSGIGYSIGIPMDPIGPMGVPAYHIDIDGVDRQECSYRQDTKEEYLTDIVNRFVDLINGCIKNRIERIERGISVQDAMDNMRSEIAAGFDEILPDLKAQIAACKHEGFWEEREWRLTVALPSDDKRVFHTSGRFGITPRIYLRLHDSQDNLLPIRRIVIGPCAHVTEALESLKSALIRKGYRIRISGESQGVEVVPSKIPYRNW